MITNQFLSECFDCDPKAGVLRFKKRPITHFSSPSIQKAWNSRWAGKVAGSPHKGTDGKTYIVTSVNGKQVKVHRVIMELLGYDLEGKEVDHIDGNGSNNKIDNLRIVNRHENSRNMKRSIKNKTGITGVVRWKTCNRWLAYINDDKNKRIYLGYHQSFFEAACARKSAELDYGYHQNHGDDRGLF